MMLPAIRITRVQLLAGVVIVLAATIGLAGVTPRVEEPSAEFGRIEVLPGELERLRHDRVAAFREMDAIRQLLPGLTGSEHHRAVARLGALATAQAWRNDRLGLPRESLLRVCRF